MNEESFGKMFNALLSKERHEEYAKTQTPIKTIGEVILLLERQPRLNIVKFDFIPFNPSRLISYRGYYEDICISYEHGGPEQTVAFMLASFKSALGQEFTGYKGGKFLMTNRTVVWVAPYGECGRMLTGFDHVEEEITLICTQKDES